MGRDRGMSFLRRACLGDGGMTKDPGIVDHWIVGGRQADEAEPDKLIYNVVNDDKLIVTRGLARPDRARQSCLPRSLMA